jgi:predicted nucleic acid-binding protein
MRHLVDSDVLIDAIKRRGVALQALTELGNETIAMSAASYGELLDGASMAPNPDRQLEEIEAFLEAFRFLAPDRAIMRRFAAIRAELRSRGRLIPDFDIVIAATAIELDLELITRNRKHFERIPGLRFTPPEELLSSRDSQ